MTLDKIAVVMLIVVLIPVAISLIVAVIERFKE